MASKRTTQEASLIAVIASLAAVAASLGGMAAALHQRFVVLAVLLPIIILIVFAEGILLGILLRRKRNQTHNDLGVTTPN